MTSALLLVYDAANKETQSVIMFKLTAFVIYFLQPIACRHKIERKKNVCTALVAHGNINSNLPKFLNSCDEFGGIELGTCTKALHKYTHTSKIDNFTVRSKKRKHSGVSIIIR